MKTTATLPPFAPRPSDVLAEYLRLLAAGKLIEAAKKFGEYERLVNGEWKEIELTGTLNCGR